MTALTQPYILDNSLYKKTHGLKSSFHVLAASLVFALVSQCAIPLWFTPIFFTFQTLAVLLMGATLGGQRAASALFLYLVEGSLGLPFFAQGRAGLGVLLGPSGGYLVGFVVAAFCVGKAFEKGYGRTLWSRLYILSSGALLILLAGTLWLSVFTGGRESWLLGFYPFVVTDLLKAALAALLLSWKSRKLAWE